MKFPTLLTSLLLALAFGACTAPTTPAAPTEQATLAPPDISGFARAQAGVALQFPADHGAHPDYQTEWWYYTGNLQTANGERFGYQLTFFRRALLPPTARTARPSTWATDQLYLAHFAITDGQSQHFYHQERFARGAAELAGAQAAPYQVWLEDWRVQATAPDRYQLTARTAEVSLQLTLQDSKGVILQGTQGYSRKGEQAGNASFYYSQTRLLSEGTLQIGENAYSVQGSSWMDHEFSTSALGKNQVGWDWFSIQLDDNSELMLFQLRDTGFCLADKPAECPTPTPNTDKSLISGTIIAPDGHTTPLRASDFQVQVTDLWQSPHSGATYPAGWQVNLPAYDLRLTITPLIPDQELQVSFTYWEGAVQVQATRASQPLSGVGYIELTGYAQSMQGEF
ncbi:MAG TPA: lipocalin-like domain-containing protein [Anaerolineales bacterium]|nr:lipocalin-like domain-containing protein [Anaerolineales bacterium]